MSKHGEFSGNVVCEWLQVGHMNEEGHLEKNGPHRGMKLIQELSFTREGKIWIAPVGARFDGASIPPALWSLVAGIFQITPFIGNHRRATVLHDHYCAVGTLPASQIHEMFLHAMLADETNPVVAYTFYFAVCLFGGACERNRGRDKVLFSSTEEDHRPKKELESMKAVLETAELKDYRKIVEKRLEELFEKMIQTRGNGERALDKYIQEYRDLEDQGIQIYLVRLTQLGSWFDELKSYLDAEELARSRRFRFEKDRTRFVLSHGLMRLLLGRRLNQSPGTVSISASQWKKPQLIQEDSLSFNISHSDEWFALALSQQWEVGIDVEELGDMDIEGLSPLVMGPERREQLLSLDPIQQRDFFFGVWVQKEAYLKAKGIGIVEGLKAAPSHDPLLFPSISLREEEIRYFNRIQGGVYLSVVGLSRESERRA